MYFGWDGQIELLDMVETDSVVFIFSHFMRDSAFLIQFYLGEQVAQWKLRFSHNL